MNEYSAYDLSTGLFTGLVVMAHSGALDSNIPDGCGCILGKYDHRTHKVDLETGEVISYRPECPDGTSVWSEEEIRWITLQELEARVKFQRKQWLAASDWVVARAMETGEPIPTEWADYRQALRNITDQEGYPVQVSWPTPPN